MGYNVRMEFYQLWQLVAFAECGSLSKAAETVHTSQPALSRSMRNLESELGVPLFNRTKNHIELTETGVIAAQHAKTIVSAHDKMARDVQEADRRLRSFSFGSIAPAPIWELTPIASKIFAEKTITSDLQETESSLVQGLNDGAYNFIVLLHPLEENDSNGKLRYVCKPFVREKLSVLLPASHRLAKRKSLSLKELAGESFLIFNKIGFWYSICKQKIPDAVFLEQNELSSLREIVLASDLPSFQTNLTRYRDDIPQDKIAVPLSDPEVDVQFWCICLAEKEREYAPLFEALRENE